MTRVYLGDGRRSLDAPVWRQRILTTRRHWPVVTLPLLLEWARKRLSLLLQSGVQSVGLEVDIGALTHDVEVGMRQCIADAGMRIDDAAKARIALSPRAASRRHSPFYCPDYWRLSTESHLEELVGMRRKLLERHAAGPVVLFIGQRHQTTPSINYVAQVLREQHGIGCFGVFMLEAPASDPYDGVFHLHGSLGLLYYLLRRLPPMPVYVQAHARWAHLGLWVKRVNPGLRVCQDIYDWTGLFVPEDKTAVFARCGVYSESDIALSCWSERIAPERLDAVFYKNGGKPIRDLLGNAADSAVQLYPAPPRAWYRQPRARSNSSQDDRLKLVFAGRIKGQRSAPPVFGDLYYLSLARDLIAQGFDLDIYWNMHDEQGRLCAEYTEYVEEAESNPYLRLQGGLPVQQLISRLNGGYDFGSILFYFEPDLVVGRGHIESALASKLFTYLAAGLPILVSAELKYMAQLVDEWGVGLVVRRDEIPMLRTRLDRVDMTALRTGVREAQRRCYLEADLPKVLSALFPQLPKTRTRSKPDSRTVATCGTPAFAMGDEHG